MICPKCKRSYPENISSCPLHGIPLEDPWPDEEQDTFPDHLHSSRNGAMGLSPVATPTAQDQFPLEDTDPSSIIQTILQDEDEMDRKPTPSMPFTAKPETFEVIPEDTVKDVKALSPLALKQVLKQTNKAPQLQAFEDILGQEIHGTYRIKRLICKGTMSSVYEATHSRLSRKRFAFKMLNPRLQTYPDAYARFRREAEIASELGHPNIVQVVDFNITDDGHPYLVMEFLRGEDLATLLNRPSLVPMSITTQIIQQTGHGLQAAHNQGVVHRDMKPENIFLASSMVDAFQTKILDFGISKIKNLESMVTHYKLVVGTPHYMSPEQAGAQTSSVDHTTDIFAMGSICYQMLTGLLPFTHPTVEGVLNQVCREQPPPIHQLRPDLSPMVQRILDKAMAKKREDRYQRVENFTRDLILALGQDLDEQTRRRSFIKDDSGPKTPPSLNLSQTRPLPLINPPPPIPSTPLTPQSTTPGYKSPHQAAPRKIPRRDTRED